MTINELSQLYYLRREIAIDGERIAKLRSRATNMAPSNGSGSSGSHGGSKVERYAVLIADLESEIASKRLRCIEEQKRLEAYIASVEDSRVRTAMVLRFSEGRSWTSVSARMGFCMTPKAVANMVYRYLERH